MGLTRNRLYIFLGLSCFAGYIWLFVNYKYSEREIAACLFRHVTGVPCPSCGSTRSVLYFFNGEFFSSLYSNPLGLIVAAIMLLAPFWIAFDLVSKRDSLFRFYKNTEKVFQKSWVAIPAILLIIGNWIWNIIKAV